MENFLKYPNDQYGSGIELNEYNGEYSLVNARQAEDGQVWKEWCYPQRNKKPIEKSLPWKIKIGSSPEEAVETLKHFIKLLAHPSGGTIRDEYYGPPAADDDDIPF